MTINMERYIFGRMENLSLIRSIADGPLLRVFAGADNLVITELGLLQPHVILTPILTAKWFHFFRPYSARQSGNGSKDKPIKKRCRRGKRKRLFSTSTDDKEQPGDTLMNFSDKSLSKPCVTALSKGLSFIPTTETNDFDTMIDFHKFFRTLRLREFFGTNEQSFASNDVQPVTTQGVTLEQSMAHLPFKRKSTFIPSKNRNSSLDTY